MSPGLPRSGEGKPRTVPPPLLPETDEDRRDFRRAQIRREHRLALRRALADSTLDGTPV